MNNSVIAHTKTISFQACSKNNPEYLKNANGPTNNASFRKRYKISIPNREFGREIVLKNNLTVYNNQEVIRTKRTFDTRNNNIKGNRSINNNKMKYSEKTFMEISYRNHHKIVKNKINDSNKENNINVINTENFKTDYIVKGNGYEGKDYNRTIYNDDGDDVEMKDETKINNNNLVIYNKYPQDVDEYFDEIFSELKEKEMLYLPDINYMSKQKDINHKMRAILIDWLIDVHLKYKMLPQTMYMSVNLIDRYLSKNETNRVKLQLVGVAAMFIASKYEEIYPPELKDFVYITDNAYVKADVLDMESKMLGSLEFDITFPTQWSFFEIFGKKLNLDQKTLNLAWFLMELSLIDYKMLKFKLSQIASTVILIAVKTLNFYNRNEFEKITGFKESELRECAREIKNYYAFNSTHSLQAIRRKFSSKKYDEVSRIHLF